MAMPETTLGCAHCDNPTIRPGLCETCRENYSDAIHIVDPRDESLTLCNGPSRYINTTDASEPPDAASGCWTCLTEFDKWKSA